MLRVDPSPILFYFYFFIRSELVRVDPSWSDPDWRSELIRSDFCTAYYYSAFQNLFCVKPLSFFSCQLPDKSIATLVKYYYSWKKTRSRTSLIDRQAKKMAVQKEPVKWVLSSWKPRLWKVILTVYKFIEGLPFYFGRKMFSFNRHPQRWRSDECLFYNLVLFCAYSIFLTTLLISFSTSDPESDNSDSSDSDFEPEKEVKFLQCCSFWLFTGSVTVILTHWMPFVYQKMAWQCNSALFTRKKNWKVIFQPSEKFTMDQRKREKLSLAKGGRVSTQQINVIHQNILG